MNVADVPATLTALRGELQSTGLRIDSRCAVFGSAVLVYAGLRDVCGDIDLAVTADLYAALAVRPGWVSVTPDPEHPSFLRWEASPGLAVDAFRAWRSDEPAIGVREMLLHAEPVAGTGLPMIPLWLVLQHKLASLGYFERQHGVPAAEAPRMAKHIRDAENLIAAGVSHAG